MAPQTRKTLSVVLLALASVVILVPFGIVGQRLWNILQEPGEALEILDSLTALVAVSLIFLDIVTGGFRPMLARVFKPAPLQRAHTAFGIAGLSFAVCHLVLLLPVIAEHYSEANPVVFLLGPVALALLLVTVTTALFMKRLKRSWRVVHLLNYVIFAAAVVHGLFVSEHGNRLVVLVVLLLYAAIALAGLGYRIFTNDWSKIVPARTGGGAE